MEQVFVLPLAEYCTGELTVSPLDGVLTVTPANAGVTGRTTKGRIETNHFIGHTTPREIWALSHQCEKCGTTPRDDWQRRRVLCVNPTLVLPQRPQLRQ